MRLLKLLFAFQGRIGRLKYWLGYCSWVVIGALVYFMLKVVVAATKIDENAVLFWGLGLFLLWPFLVSATAINLRRLHDREKSGWWLLAFYLIPTALMVIAQITVGSKPDSSMTKVGQYGSLAIYFWMIIELGFLPGTRGRNEYGDDPVASQPK